jgi:hypothetical protein
VVLSVSVCLLLVLGSPGRHVKQCPEKKQRQEARSHGDRKRGARDSRASHAPDGVTF